MCGIIGVVSRDDDVVEDARVLLNAENNRGEQACGSAVFNGGKMCCYRDEGLVAEVFGNKHRKKWFKKGRSCIMHALYSTIGRGGETKQPQMFQPLLGSFHGRPFALGHNGNLVRVGALRGAAKRAGYKFNSETSDTEVIVALLSTSKKKDFLEALREALKKIEGKGAFSLVILYEGKVIGARDQNGIRPLCVGKKNGNNDSYILASESSVFPALRSARFIREIEPGEVIVLGPDGIEKSFKWTQKTCSNFCIAELIYFSNPAAMYFGRSVYAFRAKTGEIAAQEHPVSADVVVPIPDSGRGAADGFSSESGIPKREGIVKSRYSLRTFMEPREVDRSQKQRAKLQALPDVMAGKSVCLVEDSLFRGSVARPAVSLTRVHGKAREVHLRICSPPVCCRCHLGLDTSTSKELLASRLSISEIRDKIVHADSLRYLSLKGLKRALLELGLLPKNFCLGCFTGKYPVEPPKEK
ncbi:MAG: amidophosphoribosyltransferase [Candidatus Staskawiczbacteria bacterium]|nr:amidophosphoribosyltransferase [Candidatus Staskawiczbacteria bacterium]